MTIHNHFAFMAGQDVKLIYGSPDSFCTQKPLVQSFVKHTVDFYLHLSYCL